MAGLVNVGVALRRGQGSVPQKLLNRPHHLDGRAHNVSGAFFAFGAFGHLDDFLPFVPGTLTPLKNLSGPKVHIQGVTLLRVQIDLDGRPDFSPRDARLGREQARRLRLHFRQIS